jgi:3-oxoacyl-[acyl-carrier protein] reductase
MSLVNALDFSGKRVLVCGGSDGIGYGVATAFFEAGATVSITGTRSANSYDNDFSNFTYHQLNVQDEVTITELASQFDALDVLANCVGAVLWKKAEFERSGFEKILSINLSGAMQLCTDFYPLLAQSKGSIINIDSVASINAAVNNPAYSASKAGLVQLTKVLAKKMGTRRRQGKYGGARYDSDQDDSQSVRTRPGSTVQQNKPYSAVWQTTRHCWRRIIFGLATGGLRHRTATCGGRRAYPITPYPKKLRSA